MAPPNASNPNRSANACQNCRKRKVKCSGTAPCQTCSRNGLECQFGDTVRRGYSHSYVQRLLGRIKQMEHQIRQLKSEDKDDTNLHEQRPESSTSQPADFIVAHGAEGAVHDSHGHDDNSETPSQLDEELSLSPDLASGPAFESRIRSILREHVNHDPQWCSPGSSTLVPEERGSRDLVYGPWRDANDLVDGASSPQLLSKGESERLFEKFISLLGVNQHFLDPRKFCDSLDLLYLDDTSQRHQMLTPWFTQYLLVMAVSMLISSPTENPLSPPGHALFAAAMQRLPLSYRMGSHGILAVEIFCLAGLYLQWCDRKHEAYLHVGTALRLAIGLGCSLSNSQQEGLTSEICHRNRVWWTAYMLDRRLSAGLGLPQGVDDRQVYAELPRAFPGFQPPLPLVLNVQIARATGDIMTSLYTSTITGEKELVEKIQSILKTLSDTARSIPPAFSIDFSQPLQSVSRTSASLYVMLFQAIILCIRPIILQCVRKKVKEAKIGAQRLPKSPVKARLTRSCHEAATRSIQILSSLQKSKTIALFGYFDLDATFSAAFIIVMMGFIHSVDDSVPPEGLAQAAEVLKYLSDAGNRAAELRFSELKDFCRHVWSPDNLSEEWAWLTEDSTQANTPPAMQDLAVAVPFRQGQDHLMDGLVPMNNQNPDEWSGWHIGSNMPQSVEMGDQVHDLMNFENFPLDLSQDAGDIYSCFNDPSLPLTGVDDVDWAEIGKVFRTTDTME